jgi:hypothetical protein
MNHASRRWGAVLLTSVLAASVIASAASAQQAPMVEAFLIRQDSSDCTNSNVNANDPSRIGGTAWVVRNPDGNTSVKVAITATPNTVYHFFLKCVKILGDIKTEDEGEAVAISADEQSRLARAIYGDHIFSFARLLADLVLQLSAVAMV